MKPVLYPLRRQQGQSAVEYVVVCTVLAFALGVGMVNDDSALKTLLSGLSQAYEKISFSISLP